MTDFIDLGESIDWLKTPDYIESEREVLKQGLEMGLNTEVKELHPALGETTFEEEFEEYYANRAPRVEQVPTKKFMIMRFFTGK